MPSLRLTLATARADLRTAKDALRTAEVIATLNVAGKNEAERKQATALALLDDRAYTEALAHVRKCEADVDRAEAAVADEEHELRLREVAARERLAEALGGKR